MWSWVFIASLVSWGISMIISFSLYYAGYVPRVAWNEDLVPTTCITTGHIINQEICTYDCNCHKSCPDDDDDTRCMNVCDTCHRVCWKGYYIVEYNTTSDPNNHLGRAGDFSFNNDENDQITFNGTVAVPQTFNPNPVNPTITTFRTTNYYDTSTISEANIRNELVSKRPIGGSEGCFYHGSEKGKMVYTKYAADTYENLAIAGFVFVGIFALGAIVSGALAYLQ